MYFLIAMDITAIEGDESSSTSSSVGSSPRQATLKPTYGTKFCLVAVPSPRPSPIMQRPKQQIQQDDVEGLKNGVKLTSLQGAGLSERDNRLAHPAAYNGVHGGGTKEPSKMDRMLDTLRKDLVRKDINSYHNTR